MNFVTLPFIYLLMHINTHLFIVLYPVFTYSLFLSTLFLKLVFLLDGKFGLFSTRKASGEYPALPSLTSLKC